MLMDWKTKLPLIAILRGVMPDVIQAHVEALIDAGICFIEIPTNSPEWQLSVSLAVDLAKNRAMIGAGTVLNTDQVRTLARTGAKLMVTPNTDVAVIREGVACGLTCAAGFSTPSEAFAALNAGAQALKLFPAAQYGPGYVRAIKAVLPKAVPLFAVGGVSPDNLTDYLDSGCIGAGLGGELYKAGQAPSVTRARAGLFVDAYRSF